MSTNYILHFGDITPNPQAMRQNILPHALAQTAVQLPRRTEKPSVKLDQTQVSQMFEHVRLQKS